MLLGVLILFLLTESPTGILVLVAGIVGEAFFLNVYKPLGEILDLLALVNSAVNFVLYCSMSKQFRQTFAKLFFL
ncbi:class A rhodopsin-like G-protein coupled receptor GPRmys [Leptotrombidium deliense]|uniref:Class A rhodopsin-like G-protein coupled receptor GPRmys n=1 Tax=Leptotrombidium deliense TaxID=299467 RepID=A0A443RZH9_9ACAR|nr:class A rhodopsin-like G-protein coupled receptor GPRmys [Leptotrombidium deliense]